jgi:hypothetical protein
MRSARFATLALTGALVLTSALPSQEQRVPDEGVRPNAIVVTPRPGPGPGPAPGPYPSYRLEADIWTDRDSYYIGDSVRVNFEVSRDAYVYIFNTDARGVTTQIFPNYYDGDNFARGGVTYTIPARNYDLQATGPGGRESLEIYAVTDPGHFRDVFDTYSRNQPFAPLSSEGERALNSLRVEPRPTPQGVVVVPPQGPTDWARDTTYIDVLEPVRPPIYVTGQLVVRCSPNHVAIYVDGQFAGYGPGTITNLTPGYHEIELSRPGWISYSDQIYVDPRRPTYLQIDLRRGSRVRPFDRF